MSSPTASAAPLPFAAWFGSLVGVTAWAIAIVAVTLVHGDFDGTLQVGLPCLLLAVGIWQTVTFVHLAALRAFGRGPLASRAFVGALLLAIGMLLWLCDRWAMPFLRGHPDVGRTLDRLGTATTVPWPLLWLPLLLGIALLHGPLRELLRSRPRPS